jgi:endonuclease/exonuclease/phosphatase (EEP) superfamily protein YafD
VAWTAAGALASLAASQIDGRWTTRPVALAQSLTPHAAVLLPVALAAGRRRSGAATIAAVSTVALAALTVPLAGDRRRVERTHDARPWRVAAANLLHSNDEVGRTADALLASAPDVVAFTEYTGAHHAELEEHPLATHLPHRVVAGERGSRGLAVWSRKSLEPGAIEGAGPTLAVDVETPHGRLRVIAAHTTTPLRDPRRWRGQLAQIAAEATAAGPSTIVVGDFNATVWHPPFRRILRRGLIDAHLAHGHPLSASWPVSRYVPRFVRLDHALVASGLVATGVEDLALPGSDHRGVVVSVAAAR